MDKNLLLGLIGGLLVGVVGTLGFQYRGNSNMGEGFRFMTQTSQCTKLGDDFAEGCIKNGGNKKICNRGGDAIERACINNHVFGMAINELMQKYIACFNDCLTLHETEEEQNACFTTCEQKISGGEDSKEVIENSME